MIDSILYWIGKLRLSLWFGGRAAVEVGDPKALDASGSTRWREFTTADLLFETWSPLPGTLWEAYHCPTLFAALDQIPRDKLGVAAKEWFPEWLRGQLPTAAWLDAQSWLILDAPGLVSVAIAAQLGSQQRCQTVCTFDNWPHPKGLVKPEIVLAALLRYAPLLAEARWSWHKGLPPVWVCDNGRLGRGPGKPRDFDNRYYLDDSILPGLELLRQNGIQRVIYASPNVTDPPIADVTTYLSDLIKQGMPVARLALDSLESWRSGPIPVREIPPLPVNTSGFFRSTAGGFGSPIPEPSSSSG